jgi:hypothetical protein
VKFLYPLLAILLAVFAVAPLGYPGAFQSHTGLSAVYNLIALDQNPLQFFNWAPTFGRAYDLFRTDGALPYVLAEVFHLIGFGYLDAIKLVYALAWIASGLTMFALARRWLGEAGALLAATVYVYLPYHIATVYARGAFAESVAWAIFPLALLAVVRQQTAYCLLLPALLVLIQPGVAILFALVALAIAVALDRDIFRRPSSVVGQIFGGLVLGGLLHSPTIFRYGASVARDGFNPNYVMPFQLFASLWGFGASTGSFLDQFPFQLGVAPVSLAIIAAALGWGQKGETRRVVAIFLGAAIALAGLTLEIAAPFWRLLDVFVTYPWQLLAFVGLALALAAGAAIEFDARLARPAMLAFFVALPVVASYGYLAPRFLDVTPTRPHIAVFGNNEIALLDYRIVGPLRHGATVRVHVVWQALRQVNNDYTVFVHAVHEDGEVYGQEDAKPQDGALPTIKWMPGQVISDTHTIQINVEGPREGYHLEFGMYVAATGRRALTETGADHLILPRPGDPEPTISDQLLPQAP